MLRVSDFKFKKKNNFNLFGKIKVQVLLAAAVSVMALFFAQLVFANSLATDGVKLAQIETEIKKLESENSLVRGRIAQISSLRALSAKALDLGFEAPQSIIVP